MKSVFKSILLLFTSHAMAQQVDFTAKGGFLIPHSETMKSLINHVVAAEVGVFNSFDSGHWAYENLNKPQVGVIAGAVTGSLPAITGNCYYSGVSAKKKFGNAKKRYAYLQLSMGLGWVTAPFNEKTNRQNTAVGSHINGLMQVKMAVNQKINANNALYASLDITHFSNANTRMPNLGYNFLLAGLGITHSFNKKTINPKNIHHKTNNLRIELMGKWASRQMTIDDRKNIGMGLAAINLSYPQSPIARWLMGINYFYDRSYVHTDLKPLPSRFGLGRVSEVALSAGHMYLIGRVAFTAEGGIYLYRPAPTKRRYYEAVGMRYYINTNWFVCTRLKAHLTSADYVELGLGYKIDTKQANLKRGFVEGWKYALNKGSFGLITFKN